MKLNLSYDFTNVKKIPRVVFCKHLVTVVAYLIVIEGWSANSKIALKMLNFDDQFEVEVERQIWLHERGEKPSH